MSWMKFWFGLGDKRKGQILSNNVIGFIGGVAVVGILLFWAVSLFSAESVASQTSGAYIDKIKGELEIVSSGGVGEFTMLDMKREDANFYLVYFGGVSKFSFDGKDFSVFNVKGNTLCVCYDDDGRVSCGDCLNSEVPLSFDGDRSDAQVFEDGVRFGILKRGDYYEFSSK